MEQINLKAVTRINKNAVAVAQIPGRWHTDDVFRETTELFAERGHPVINIPLPISVKGLNFDDHAKVAEETIRLARHKRVAAVGWSLAGNLLPRLDYFHRQNNFMRFTGRVALTDLIYVAATIEPKTLPWVTEEQLAAEPEKNSLYIAAIVGHHMKQKDQNPFVLDPQTARETIYRDCSDEVAADQISRMRPHWFQKVQPIVRRKPKTPSWYIYCENDAVVDYEFYQPWAVDVLGIPEENTRLLEGCGHAPMVSRPQEYVDTICEIIEK